MNSEIYLCYKRTLTSIVAASLVFEKLRNNGYSVFFSRKLRENDFIQHISEVIEPVKDAVVLLDERSFQALKEGNEKFLGSWFGRELQEVATQKKNIIVICLNGYTLPNKSYLPKEVHFLYDAQTLELDTFDLNVIVDLEAIVGKLTSKPAFKYIVENRTSYENTADFLIYSNGDCNIYEYGYLIATLDSNVDKHHPFKYTVNRSGEHYFYIINNDTGQIKELNFDINPGHQKYVYIEWDAARDVDSLKEDEINRETDSSLLYTWGKSFFYPNPKRVPDYHRSFLCFARAAELGHQKAVEFIRKYDHSLSSIYKVPQEVVEQWYKKAAEYGSPEAWMKMGETHETVSNYDDAIKCYERAKKLAHADADMALERCRKKICKGVGSSKERFMSDFHTIIENFERRIGTVIIGKYNRQVQFESIVEKLKKVENYFSNPNNDKWTKHFYSDSEQSKYRNRLLELLGFLANEEVFENLTHKDIMEIGLKGLHQNLWNDTLPNYTQIARSFNRMNESSRRGLSNSMRGVFE